nr:hypothetical protein BaRGS_020312 [Batillaria attramentaria]
MAAANDVFAEPQETECPVCHEEFSQPKILPCAHVICRDCLVKWMRSDSEGKCPICRCAVADPSEQPPRSWEEVADSLPTDLAMAAMVESLHVLCKEHVCCVCDGVEAVSVCLNCGDLLCESCVRAHGKLSATRHHAVEALASLTAERLAASRPVPCPAHAEEPSTLFCSTHGMSVCLLCATSDHRACPEVTKLETKAEEARALLVDLVNQLTASERELERAMEELDQRLLQAENNEETALAEIDSTFQRLQNLLDACRSRLTDLAKRTKSDVRTGVHDGKAVLGVRKGKLTSHKRLVERSRRTTPYASLGSVANMLQTRVQGLDCSNVLPGDLQTVTLTTVKIDQAALSRVERELENLGERSVMPAPPSSSARQPAGLLWFHGNHGSNIKLSNDQQTAEKIRDTENGNSIIVGVERIKENQLYEIQVEEKGKRNGYVLWTGVTVREPDQLKLPYSAGLWTDAIVISNDHVTEPDGDRTDTKVGKLLRNVPYGSRIGVLVDAARSLHLYFDGQDQGVVARYVPEECFPFFDIFGNGTSGDDHSLEKTGSRYPTFVDQEEVLAT